MRLTIHIFLFSQQLVTPFTGSWVFFSRNTEVSTFILVCIPLIGRQVQERRARTLYMPQMRQNFFQTNCIIHCLSTHPISFPLFALSVLNKFKVSVFTLKFSVFWYQVRLPGSLCGGYTCVKEVLYIIFSSLFYFIYLYFNVCV